MTAHSAKSRMSTSELTIRVLDLAAADKFYDRILRPIGYQFQSRVSHDLDDGWHTIESTYGPVNTDRVDLRLSQSSQHTILSEERAEIEFCAPSVFAVRQFFEAGVQTGAKIAAQPSADGGRFVAGIRDPDGHMVLAACDDPMTAKSRNNRLIITPNSASTEDSDTNSTILGKARQVADERTPSRPPKPVSPMLESRSVAPAQTSRSPRSRVLSSRRAASPAPVYNSRENRYYADVNVKNIMAGAVVVSAGAALVYGAYKEFADSKKREYEHHRSLRRRDELEVEARAHARSSDLAVKEPVDRDSGYYSVTSVTKVYGSSRSRPLQDHGSKGRRQSRGSDERPYAMTHPNPKGQSTKSSVSGSTIKPTVSDRKRSYVAVWQGPSKPSRPTPPTSRLYCRGSPDHHRHQPMAQGSAQTGKPATKRWEQHSVNKPSSGATDGPGKPTSRAGTRHSTSTTHTARFAPLSADTVKTNTTVREARKQPLPSTPSRSKTGRTLDDLASVGPDDSISNVSTQRGSRVPFRV